MRFTAWMGAAIAVCAMGAAHAQSNVQSSENVSAPLTRDQVVRDLEQWHAAGMSFVPHPAGYADAAQSPEYQRYQQAQQAPSGTQAVAKSQSPASSSTQQQ